MALWDEVKSRYPTQKLIELSNPNNPNATTINDAVGTLAATDTEAEFKMRTGTVYDNTNADHKAVAVEGVIVTLLKRSNIWTELVKSAHDRWVELTEQFALRIGAQARVIVLSNSQLTATRDKRGGTAIVRPAFDDPHFDDLKPAPPTGGRTDIATGT